MPEIYYLHKAISHFRSSSESQIFQLDVISNRSTAPWRPRIFFSSCSLQVQWSRYLFCFGVSVSVLIFAMLQDQALVASKSKHYLIETKEKPSTSWRGKSRVWNDFELLRGWIELYWVEQSLIYNNFRRVVKTTMWYRGTESDAQPSIPDVIVTMPRMLGC